MLIVCLSPRDFNPRPREGGDGGMVGYSRLCIGFQSTPPRRGRPGYGLPATLKSTFQSTPPRRGRPAPTSTPPKRPSISIHAPAKGATSSIISSVDLPSFQSTPPRRGRPALPLFDNQKRTISIHAPAKGATVEEVWVILAF